MRVMLENRLFLSDIYLLIHSTKQTARLKSYYVRSATEDTDMQKISWPGMVYSVLCRTDAYTPTNNTRWNRRVSLYLAQVW